MSTKISFTQSVIASRALLKLSNDKIDRLLLDLADHLVENVDYLLLENSKDLALMDPQDYKYDRLKLTEKRIKDMAHDIRNVAGLQNPISQQLSHKELPNGLTINKVRVPIGVIGIIYEARPNVTIDVFSLCLKTKNAVVLKGGSDAMYSNTASVKLIRDILEKHSVNTNTVFLMPSDREQMTHLMNAIGEVDLIIPRGSQQLINYVRQNAKVPVIETGAGIVHTYFDVYGDIKKAKTILHNAKTRRVSVCNSLDCLIIHQDRLGCLPELMEMMGEENVKLYADEASLSALVNRYPADLLFPATAESFGTEFLDYKLAIKTVKSIDEALEHIAQYSSKHSEAILSENAEHIARFLNEVDAAAVYVNTSTAFTDGAQFGLGAEVGISTQKIHARGPMGLEELTSYKWIITSNGQIRVS